MDMYVFEEQFHFQDSCYIQLVGAFYASPVFKEVYTNLTFVSSDGLRSKFASS